ncbi:MAG: helix-turn-helix domain-containing protein [Planctomycetes bacterium]|nr:helix-turn-helix domain-containing protein [Planctomycetota bacterium]
MENAIILRGVRLDADAVFCEQDLADALGVRCSTLRRARRSGEIRYIQRGRSILYRGDAVRAWLESPICTSTPVSEGGAR